MKVSVVRRNETKFFVLTGLEELQEPVSPGILQTWLEIEHNLEMTLNNIRVALSRYHKMGLIRRRAGKYSLSDRGKKRLDWLRQVL